MAAPQLGLRQRTTSSDLVSSTHSEMTPPYGFLPKCRHLPRSPGSWGSGYSLSMMRWSSAAGGMTGERQGGTVQESRGARAIHSPVAARPGRRSREEMRRGVRGDRERSRSRSGRPARQTGTHTRRGRSGSRRCSRQFGELSAQRRARTRRRRTHRQTRAAARTTTTCLLRPALQQHRAPATDRRDERLRWRR